MNKENNIEKMNTKYVGHHVSAGGFIFHQDEKNKLFVVLVKNKKGQYWIPKGHIEKNENQLDASYREIEEEVGINMKNLKHIKMFKLYQFCFLDENSKKNTKEIYMNVFECLEKVELIAENIEDGDLDDAEWFEYKDALKIFLPYSLSHLKEAMEIFIDFKNKSKN